MTNLNIEVPEPSKFVSFTTIDSIALKVSQTYRTNSKNKNGLPLDCERFIDWLDLCIYSNEFDEPDGASFFAGLSLLNNGTIYINEKHRELFDSRPDVYTICLGHEIGHAILKHLNYFLLNQDLPLFYEDTQKKQFMLHSSSWFQYGLSKPEVEQRKEFSRQLRESLVKKALIDTESRLTLQQLDEKFKPEWMFKQAEHFAKCLCIPHDKLYEVLEVTPLMKGWSPIYKLAQTFGVSASVMKSRLLNLKLIEIGEDGQPIPSSPNFQQNLFG